MVVATLAFLMAQVDDGALQRQAAVIRPRPAELSWLRIPWLTDLAKAQRAARKEGRPILMWVSNGDPLDHS